MKYKRAISLLLVTVMALGMLSGCQNEPSASDTPPNIENDTQEQVEVDKNDIDAITSMEYDRAIAYGFLLEGMESVDPDATVVTWEQYCSILGNMIRLQDESALPAWEDLTADAPETEMKRDGALIALLFAGKTLEIDCWNTDEAFMYDGYDWGGDFSWEYPIFPWDSSFSSEDEMLNDPNNSIGPAYAYCVGRISLISERPLMNVESGTGELYLQNALTLRDALTSVVRLYESIEHDPVNYISVRDVSTYDKGIITDELLNAPSDLPEVTQQKLPSEWKGAGTSARKDGRHFQQDFMEADIAFLAENGLNFTRVFFGFTTLRYPDFPEDVSLVNETELLELDQLIAWGIEYGVHIQLSMIDTPSDLESMDLSEEEWENVRAYWEMLAHRYAGISSRYLSFDLANELQPSEENLVDATENMKELVSGLRAVDPERVLLISFHGNPLNAWVENMAEIGLALGCHPYAPTYLCGGDDWYTAPTAYWPYPYFPAKLNAGESIKISGDIGGNTLKIDFWVYRPFTVTFSDGTVMAVDVQGDYIDEMSCDWRFNEPYAIEIPEGVSELVIVPQNECFTILELIIECDGEMTGLVPADSMEDRLHGGTELTWIEDGWSSEKIYSADLLYTEKIQPMQQIAKEHSVGFMCNEFGIFGNNVGWNVALVASYTDDVLTMMEEQGISWCLCEAEGWPYRFLTVPDGRRYEWENATLETKTYDFEDGTGRTFQYCKELVDVFRKHTMD